MFEFRAVSRGHPHAKERFGFDWTGERGTAARLRSFYDGQRQKWAIAIHLQFSVCHASIAVETTRPDQQLRAEFHDKRP